MLVECRRPLFDSSSGSRLDELFLRAVILRLVVDDDDVTLWEGLRNLPAASEGRRFAEDSLLADEERSR